MKMFFLIAILILLQQATAPAAYAGEGHDAGYKWAEEKGIDDPSDCGGNSQSFIEGCEEYAEENAVEEE